MIVEDIIKKYETRNPFEIARSMGIIVIYENLGEINGYFNTVYKQKQIHINSNLSERKKLFTAAHELGHAVLHPNENTPFLKGSTYLSVSRLEKEANLFAVTLLVSNDDLLENREKTISQIACVFGLNEDLIKLRILGK